MSFELLSISAGVPLVVWKGLNKVRGKEPMSVKICSKY